MQHIEYLNKIVNEMDCVPDRECCPINLYRVIEVDGKKKILFPGVPLPKIKGLSVIHFICSKDMLQYLLKDKESHYMVDFFVRTM